MKIKKKYSSPENIELYQLDGWDNDDWMTSSEFVNELIESEADYQIIPSLKLKQGKTK